MGRRGCVLLCVLAVLIMTGGGFGRTPVMQSVDYYINDYAGLLSEVQREQLSTVARDTGDRLDIDVILLTVESLEGIRSADYIQSIFSGWQLEGNIVFLLVSSEDEILYVWESVSVIPPTQQDYIQSQIIRPFAEGSGFSTGISNAYMATVKTVFDVRGFDDYTDWTPAEAVHSGVPVSAWAFLILIVVVVGRSFRVHNKYRAKYLFRHKYPRKDFSVSRPEYDDMHPDRFNDSEIDMDAHPARPVIRREGFVVYREPYEDSNRGS